MRLMTQQKKSFSWRGLLVKFWETFRWSTTIPGAGVVPDFLSSLEEARREWKYAKIYFNCVTDPDLIDYAVFLLGATEKKYVYLLKKARQLGVNVDPYQLG